MFLNGGMASNANNVAIIVKTGQLSTTAGPVKITFNHLLLAPSRDLARMCGVLTNSARLLEILNKNALAVNDFR